MRSSHITLVTTCDENYLPLLAALLKSIELTHLSCELIDMYIVEDGIRETNRRKVERSVDRNKLAIRWVAMNDVIPKGVKLPLDNTTWPQNTYMRFFVPYFIPEHIEKAIYLDVDMILRRDISELWNVDLGKHLLAAVTDESIQVVSNSWGGIKNYQKFGLSAEDKYLNAGLLVMDLKGWRREDMPIKLVNCVHENIKTVRYNDQYALNVLFANKWLELDSRWNCFVLNNIPDPFIIHFILVKPIYKNYAFNEDYRREFLKCLNETEFRDQTNISSLSFYMVKAKNKITKRVKSIFA